MSRIAYLPARGDPFVLQMNLYLFNHVWQDEVDKLYITTNSTIEQEVVEFMRNQATKNPKIIYNHIPHDIMASNAQGLAINKMMDTSDEEFIMMIEDDSFCYQKGYIDKYFKILESGEYDIVASPKWQNTPGLQWAATEHLNLTERENQEGAGFWTAFFFIKKEHLYKTDRMFDMKEWKAGDYIKELDFHVTEREVGDGNIWMSLQLRALGLRVFLLPQINDTFQDDLPFLHVGSLSGFINSNFSDDNNIPLAKRKLEEKIPVIHDQLLIPKILVERKFAWLELFLRKFEKEFNPIDEFRQSYIRAMRRYGERFNFDWNAIQSYSREYETMMYV